MPDIITSADIKTFMQSANFAGARTSLGLGALATITPGTGIATALAINVGSAGAPILFNGAGGTPSSMVGTNITGTASGLTAGAVAVGGITGLGTGVATFLATPSSVNLASAVTGETGTGALVFGSSPTIDAPTLTGTTTATTVNATNANVTNFLPVSNDGAAIGASGTAFSDLFLATGAVINIGAGNWTGTHSSGILTIGTSMDIRMTTAGTNSASVVTVGGSQTLTSKTLTSPTLTTPVLGTPSSGNLSSCTADGTNAVGYRNVPQNAKTGSYTLLATDVGKVVPNTTGGWTVNNSVHTAGDVISVYNDSGSSQNITAGTISTMRLAGTATTGTRALAARGLATLYFQTASEVIVSGAGVT